jgi:hypothetical protein
MLTRIVPLSIAQGINIVFSNKLYLYLTVRTFLSSFTAVYRSAVCEVCWKAMCESVPLQAESQFFSKGLLPSISCS